MKRIKTKCVYLTKLKMKVIYCCVTCRTGQTSILDVIHCNIQYDYKLVVTWVKKWCDQFHLAAAQQTQAAVQAGADRVC